MANAHQPLSEPGQLGGFNTVRSALRALVDQTGGHGAEPGLRKAIVGDMAAQQCRGHGEPDGDHGKRDGAETNACVEPLLHPISMNDQPLWRRI